ncbi:MAG TPA: toll/interleukin-1 receptor domain-containing protein [Mycobacterium sp.]|nr:toll/interleukin-1 receptor domain-containing protein [Mycobacterium sp.]
MTVFISHSSRDAAAVQTLVKHIESANEAVWLDTELTGGQAWWDEILNQIRGCTVFLFALSNNSRTSKPCRAELDYAKALGLPILPVEIGDTDSYGIDPLFSDVIDYRTPDVDSSIRLITTLRKRAAERGELPDPLPEPPPIPYEYLQRLGVTIESSEPLTLTQQTEIVFELQRALNDEQEETVHEDIRHLLRALRRRPDVAYTTATEIDRILAESKRPEPEQAPSPPTEPAHPVPVSPAWSTTAPQPAATLASPSGPPPAWGAAPPASSGKRRLWIALGAGGIALIAIVALVVLLVVHPWSSSKSTASSVSSTSAASTTSPTSSATTSTSTSATSDPDAVNQLRGMLPNGYSANTCEPDEPLGNALATLKCGPNTEPGGPGQALYSLFASTSDMKTVFNRLLQMKNSQLVTCPGDAPSPTDWHTVANPDVTVGSLACQSFDNQFNVMWTYDDKRLLDIANGDQLDPLFTWWTKNG